MPPTTQIKEVKEKFQSLLDRLGAIDHRLRANVDNDVNDDIERNEAWATELEAISKQLESLELLMDDMQEQINDNMALIFREFGRITRRFLQEPLGPLLYAHPHDWSDHKDAEAEDGSQFTAYFLANFVDANDRNVYPRRYLVDMRANQSVHSTCAFIRNYPAKFDAIYVIDIDPKDYGTLNRDLHQCADTLSEQEEGYTKEIKEYVHIDPRHIGLEDIEDSEPPTIGIKNFLYSTIATSQDFVVVRMNLDLLEQDILELIAGDKWLRNIIDEVFVGLRYKRNEIKQWSKEKDYTRAARQAQVVLERMRDYGMFVHPWFA